MKPRIFNIPFPPPSSLLSTCLFHPSPSLFFRSEGGPLEGTPDPRSEAGTPSPANSSTDSLHQGAWPWGVAWMGGGGKSRGQHARGWLSLMILEWGEGPREETLMDLKPALGEFHSSCSGD